MFKRTCLLGTGVCLALIGVFALNRTNGGSPSVEAVSLVSRSLVETKQPGDPDNNRAPVPPSLAIPVPIEITLSEFWGEEWVAMRVQLESSGMDLDEAKAPPEPWDDVSEAVCQRLRLSQRSVDSIIGAYAMPGYATSGALREQRFRFEGELDSVHLGRVDQIVASFEAPLADGIQRYTDGIRAGVDTALAKGDFRRGPYELPADRSEQIVYQGVVVHAGWCVSYALTAEDFPVLANQNRLMNGLKQDRRKAVQQYLDSL